MALENKKLSTYDDLLSSNIDTTTKLVVLTGATKVNANLPVTSFVEDSLTSNSVVKPLSAAKGKSLQDTKAPIANPTFTGTVNGITKAMVGLGNVDNTSDAGKPISTATQNALDLKLNASSFNDFITLPVSGDIGKLLTANDDGTASWGNTINTPLITNLQTFADNTAAAALETGTIYKTSTGVLMIKY